MSSPTRPAPTRPDGPPAVRDPAAAPPVQVGWPAAATPAQVTAPPLSDVAVPPRRSPRLLLGVTLVAGLVLGLVIARWLTGAGPTTTTPSVQRLNLPGVAAGVSAPAPPPPPAEADRVAPEQATSPEAAVRGFLTAEALGDFTASYALLGPDDLATYPTPDAWVAAHAELAPISGFAIEEVTDATVVTITGLRSSLDQVMGLIPARSRDSWMTVEVDGSFRVDHEASTTMPLYPSDAEVSVFVARWAEARQGCSTEGQVDGVLLGAPALAEQLCGASGEVVVGQAGTLGDGTSTTPLLNAYGPEVFTWARVVDVREPVALQAVTAPIADAWQVIAVLPTP